MVSALIKTTLNQKGLDSNDVSDCCGWSVVNTHTRTHTLLQLVLDFNQLKEVREEVKEFTVSIY